MKILHSISDLSSLSGPVVLAIGVFDGVHLGHQAVLKRALVDAEQSGGTAVAVSFDPHPAKVLRPEAAPKLLTSTPHKLRLIEAMGFQHALLICFDEAFAATSPEFFLSALRRACRSLQEIVVGCGWVFGHNRTGSVDLIRSEGEAHGFEAIEIPSVTSDGVLVSSTRIRKAVEDADLAGAAALLGRPYEVLGTVVAGSHLGRTLGFPTANIESPNELFPPNGVYSASVSFDGQSHPAVANIGIRPTVDPVGKLTLEAHLPGFSGDLYGREVTIAFQKFLRPEQRFSSRDELQAQIARDLETAASLAWDV